MCIGDNASCLWKTVADPKAELFDIVIVGAGGSGLAAAVAAADAGASVILLEKCSTIGGTTALSVGSISAAGTRLQKSMGITDDVASFRADMEGFWGELAPRAFKPLQDLLASEAATTVDWLEELGVIFAGPFPEPPHRVNRMHNAIPNSRAYLDVLLSAARRRSVEVRTDCRITDLVCDVAGRVQGVSCGRGSTLVRFNARQGVVLACGDFSGSQELKKRYLTEPQQRAIPVRPDSTGDGHMMAEQIGAGFRNMDVAFAPQLRFPSAAHSSWVDRLPKHRIVNRICAVFLRYAPSVIVRRLAKSVLLSHMSPSEKLFREGALLVDREGRRIETAKPAASLAMAPGATGYIVLREAVAKRFAGPPLFISTAPGIAYACYEDYRIGRPDITHLAPDVQRLAAALTLPVDVLRDTLSGLGNGPLVAFGPVMAAITIVEGGLAVDEQFCVLRPDGTVIEGLFAVGGTGQGGTLLKGHGLHLAWAFTSGRLAGTAVALGEGHQHD
jgi:fumarate reductase flavoprotein subunit